MDKTNLYDEIFSAIMQAIESKLHMIGSVVDRDARRGMLEPNQHGGKRIYDKGDFYRNANYVVQKTARGMSLAVGSNVAHEQYVLGGKEPSWTPIKPLIEWVQRKNLSWVDKKSGMRLKVEQMAYMIRSKILAEGIEPRNVYAEVIEQQMPWIMNQLNSIEVTL